MEGASAIVEGQQYQRGNGKQIVQVRYIKPDCVIAQYIIGKPTNHPANFARIGLDKLAEDWQPVERTA